MHIGVHYCYQRHSQGLEQKHFPIIEQEMQNIVYHELAILNITLDMVEVLGVKVVKWCIGRPSMLVHIVWLTKLWKQKQQQ